MSFDYFLNKLDQKEKAKQKQYDDDKYQLGGEFIIKISDARYISEATLKKDLVGLDANMLVKHGAFIRLQFKIIANLKPTKFTIQDPVFFKRKILHKHQYVNRFLINSPDPKQLEFNCNAFILWLQFAGIQSYATMREVLGQLDLLPRTVLHSIFNGLTLIVTSILRQGWREGKVFQNWKILKEASYPTTMVWKILNGQYPLINEQSQKHLLTMYNKDGSKKVLCTSTPLKHYLTIASQVNNDKQVVPKQEAPEQKSILKRPTSKQKKGQYFFVRSIKKNPKAPSPKSALPEINEDPPIDLFKKKDSK